MSKEMRYARAISGVLLVLGLIASFTMEQVIGASLPDRTLDIYTLFITAFFGLHIITERRDRIVAALVAAIEAWAGPGSSQKHKKERNSDNGGDDGRNR